MRVLRCGCSPLLSRIARTVGRLGLAGSVVCLAGCASTRQPNYAGVPVPAPIPQQVSERGWTAEVEDDGRPAQAPPIRRMRPEEDDPTQPWSQNYGRGTAVPALPVVPAPRPTWPKPIETAVRSTSSGGVAGDADADAVIARAINAHEMRRP